MIAAASRSHNQFNLFIPDNRIEYFSRSGGVYPRQQICTNPQPKIQIISVSSPIRQKFDIDI